MDICLNVSSKPIINKTSNNSKSNIPSVKTKQNNEGSFNFKWDNSKKVKSSFLSKKNPTGNKIIPQKPSNTTKKDSIIINNKSEHVKSSAVDNGKDTLNTTTNEKFKRKVFPLFDNFSKHKTKSIDDNVDKTHSTEQMFSAGGRTFKDLAIHPHISTNLERIGLTVVTTIQEKTIPVIQSGKNVFIRSQTGSGKSLSYAVPIVNGLQCIQPHINRKDGVQAVIIVPTRELVLQTYELFLKLVEPFRWIVPGKLCGGEKRSSEKARLRKGITILIGTPGRLLDHVLHTQNFKLNTVRYLVLDEADRLLDMGFQKDVNKLVQHISDVRNVDYDPIAMMKSARRPVSDSGTTKSNVSERQTILLSATLTSSVQDLATFTMKDYVYIDPLNSSGKPDIHMFEEQQSKEIIMPETLKQKYIVTDVKTRLVVLSALIVGKFSEENCKMFIFMASRQMVDYHEELFKKCLVKRPKKEGANNNNNLIDPEEESDDSDMEEEDVLDIEFFKLHGSMEQKERVDIFKSFRAANKGVLLCTDVAARGIDIPHADYVVQYTGPLTDDDYVHRVGRTGRAGQHGQALLFLTEPELEYVNHLKEKKLFLKREQQDQILQNLLPFMSHISPGSSQAAAEVLQRRFENALIKDNSLLKAACLAYSSWSRYYSSYPVLFKRYFDFKTAHLGHYVTSFALRKSPQEVGRIVRAAMGKTSEKNVNKKLDNHITEETKQSRPVFKTKKRVRSKELLLSEFDNGLMPAKKKKKNLILT